MRTYTDLRRLYNFCALSGLFVSIQILHVKRLVHTYMGFFALSLLCVRIRIYFNVSVIQSWGFVNSFDKPMIWSWGLLIHLTFVQPVVMERLEDTSGGCDLQGSFSDDMYFLIGPSWGSFFWVPPRSLFGVVRVIHCPTLTSDRLLLRNNITRCSNIKYALCSFGVVRTYVRRVLRVLWV